MSWIASVSCLECKSKLNIVFPNYVLVAYFLLVKFSILLSNFWLDRYFLIVSTISMIVLWVNENTINLHLLSLFHCMCKGVFSFHVYFISLNLWSLWKSEESIGSPRTGDIDHCELKCGSWKLNVGSLEKKPVLLTSEPLIHICSGSVHISWELRDKEETFISFVWFC